MVTTGILPPQGKIPMVEPGIEPGTSWLVVRSSDHQTTRLVAKHYLTKLRIHFAYTGYNWVFRKNLTVHKDQAYYLTNLTTTAICRSCCMPTKHAEGLKNIRLILELQSDRYRTRPFERRLLNITKDLRL